MDEIKYEDPKMNICSLQDFVKAIKEYKDICEEYINGTKGIIYTSRSEYFYRGESNYYQETRPTVFRNKMLQYEDRMLYEVIMYHPEEFKEYEKNKFDTLVKMQHYGLPTRLLDVTINPFVALYFACLPNNQKEETDGKLLMIYGKPNSQSDIKIRKLANLAFRPSYFEIKDFKKSDLFKEEGENNEEIWLAMYYYTMEQNYIVLPNQTNERLKRQGGAFVIMGNKSDTEDKNYYKKQVHSFNSVYIESDSPYRIDVARIDGEKKQIIRSELNEMGINEAYLFPELEHSTKYIKEKYYKKAHK